MTNAAAPAPGPSLTKQASWLMATQAVAFAMTLLLPILLVRVFTQEEFGLYRQIFLAVAAAIGILPLGFQMSAFHFLVREPAARQSIVLHILLVHGIVGALACALLHVWPNGLALLFGTPELAAFAPTVGWIVLLWTLSTPLEVLPVADRDVRLSTIFIVSVQASKTVLFATGALMGSVHGLLYAAVLQGLLQCTVLAIYLHLRFGQPWRRFDPALLRAQLTYAFPLGVSGLLARGQTDVHHYFVSHAFGPAGYAVYSAGVFNLPFIGLVRDSLGSVMIPRVSKLEQQGAHREVVAVTARVATRLAALFFPVYAFLLVTSREFIELLFTKQYLDAWPVFVVNLTLVPLGIIMVDPITRAYAEQRLFVLRLRLALLSALVLVLALGTSRIGPVGTIAAVVTVNVLAVIITLPRIARLLAFRRSDLTLFADVGRLAAATAIAGVAALFVRTMTAPFGPLVVLAACAAVFVPVYVAGAALLAPSAMPVFVSKGRARWRIAARSLLTGSN